MSGWICSYRKIWDHPLFKGNAQRVGAWHWMMHMAVISDTRFMADGQVITLQRGQFCASQQQICDATGMTRKQVRSFLDALEAESAVVLKRANGRAKGRTIVTICNYDEYQSKPESKGPSEGQARAKQGPTKEQVNKIPPTGGDEIAADDPAAVMFRAGRKLLAQAGISDRQAGTLIGKWRKDHGAEAVIVALGRAQREGAIDPVAYIEGCLKFSRKQVSKPKNGEIREINGGQQIYDQHMGWMKLYA